MNPIFHFTPRRHFSVDPHIVVSTLTESIQAVHAYTGLPWWALIPLTTFTLRTVWTLPLAVLQRKRIQKQSSLRPIVSAMNPVLKLNLAKRIQGAKRKAEQAKEKVKVSESTDSMAESYLNMQSPLASMKYEEVLVLTSKETRKRQKELFKKHDVQLWKNFILPAFQIPLWVSMSLTMRDLCGWSTWESLRNKPLDEALHTEGLFWFNDLAVADPYHVFPLILGITALCNVEWTFKTLELLRLTQKRKLRPTITDAISNLSRMTIVFMMAISLHAPAGLSLYWLSSQVYSLIQNVIMDLMKPISYTPNKRLNYSQANKDAVDVVKHGTPAEVVVKEAN
ncbi:uncharacterized protein CANTADRAFT_53151 [Suhomyces tanzawaensis NRRL Y-17324]|uniref:Membrane insertase YidC/Oxa/ALB C-terminal domain-containing protein n=1 Tax=Suhomyces tanzawaensis NRRL Y-17324 TaxID=984487 RepID=A0A1E4SGT0_9ASCO|nr:uncharacterized protein CANTADRAFT_53151 [Suhomyces tanzawaensis NRRL Y-17324]ODV78711.1 hypothetical protein CANTADRAFT_53151 [Suhomyces tanzawaensis NRRL Y-17324]